VYADYSEKEPRGDDDDVLSRDEQTRLQARLRY
jgi:hypothetical protein